MVDSAGSCCQDDAMAEMKPAGIDFVETAGVRIGSRCVGVALAQRVWDALVDTERWPEWFRGFKAARNTSETFDGVGSSRWVHVDMFKGNERFIVWDEPRQWGFTGLDANLPFFESVVEVATLKPKPTGTTLSWTFAVTLKPWARPLTPLLKWQFSRLLPAGLAGLDPYLDGLHK
jgi:hypothetical protein